MLKIISKSHFMNNRTFYLILFVGLLLRVLGVTYGYPYIFHIDEPTIVRSTLGLRYSSEIGHFDWPHFTFYFNYFFYFIFIKARGVIQIIGLRNPLENVFPILWNDPFVFYFITRLLNAVLGALTIVPVFLMAKQMFSKKVGLIAAGLFAITPYLVYISHVAIPDSLMLFFVAWGIYYAYKFSVSLEYKDVILSGLIFGLASSVKYNAVLLSVVLPLFVFFSLKAKGKLDFKSIKDMFMKFVVFGLMALLGLLATSPEIIMDWGLFWSYEYGKGFLWQLTENSGPLGLSEYFPGLVEQAYKIFLDTGVFIVTLFVFSIYKVFAKEDNSEEKRNVGVMSFVVILFVLFTSRYSRATSHYFISMYPLLITVSALGLSKLNIKILYKGVFTVLFLLSLYNMMLFLREDTRHIALVRYYEKIREQGGRTHFKGNDLSETDLVNNLNMKRLREGYKLGDQDIVLSQTAIENDDKIVLIETIGNFFRKGPIIYVYKKAI